MTYPRLARVRAVPHAPACRPEIDVVVHGAITTTRSRQRRQCSCAGVAARRLTSAASPGDPTDRGPNFDTAPSPEGATHVTTVLCHRRRGPGRGVPGSGGLRATGGAAAACDHPGGRHRQRLTILLRQ